MKRKNNIKVLGSGFFSCKILYESTIEVIEALNLDSELEYVTDINKIITLGVIETPALVINNKVILSGKLLSLEELKNIIKNEL
jgi:small redox-active disulfide protein 2